MSVNKVKEVDVNTTPSEGNGIIRITIMEKYAPVLIDTYRCDEIVIWWDCNPNDFDAAIYVYSAEYFKEDEIDYQIIEEYTEPDVMEAIHYAFDKLI